MRDGGRGGSEEGKGWTKIKNLKTKDESRTFASVKGTKNWKEQGGRGGIGHKNKGGLKRIGMCNVHGQCLHDNCKHYVLQNAL